MKHLVKIVPKILSKDEKAHKKSSYPHAHRLGDTAEIEHFGKKQFDYINERIQKLPRGHWAGTHTSHHNIHISQEFLDIIPSNKRKSVIKELKVHERIEDIEMNKRKKK